MKFTAVGTKNDFQIHVADEKAGDHAGEPVARVVCVDEDGDRKALEFFSSDALDAADVELLKAILDKLGAHAVKTLA